MAGIWLKRGELINELFEITGYKTGICLTYDEMYRFISDCYAAPIFEQNQNNLVRIRPEEYEELYFSVLTGVGYIPSGSIVPDISFPIAMFHKYKNDPKKLDKFEQVFTEFANWLKNECNNFDRPPNRSQQGKGIDPTPFVTPYIKSHDRLGLQISIELIQGLSLSQQMSPWNRARRVEWKDTVELSDLFKKESLETYYGSFIDQRFIDYLSNNLDDVRTIHWRKFEGLVCEYFQKLGYHVEIGPGRNDGGIDARVWREDKDKENPPLIVIQCKRQKAKVGKVVVKALWADIEYEKANSGLLVTSSHVELGAKQDCIARGYNVNFAEREALHKWIKNMRTPNTGLFI